MKITKLKTFLVPPRWLFLKIETDEGIVGWGEPVIEGRANSVQTMIDELSDYLIGEDPLQINKLWTIMYRGGFYRGGPILMSAIAGIDQALWDIKGKYHNTSVNQLLGGRLREKMKVYSWVGGDHPNDIYDQVIQAKQNGFNAIKMNGTSESPFVSTPKDIQATVDRVAEARRAGGDDFGIGIDFHGRVHRATAKVLLKELEPFQPMFVEEPVLPENLDCLKNIASNTSIPIATGERLFTRFDYKDILQSGWVDIIQPDLSHCGGISEGLRIATMAEAYDVSVAFHCPLGPLTLASSLQLDSVCYNAVIQEQSMGIHYNKGADILDYMKNPEVFKVTNGYMNIPQGPGLGVEIDEQMVIKRSKEEPHRWRNPVWSYEDGSLAEW